VIHLWEKHFMKTAGKPARIVAREPIVDRKQQLCGFFESAR
jgi:hypothetical protein